MIDVRLTQVQILLEPNWTAEQDRKYVDHLIGDDWDFTDLLLRCFDSLRDMSAALRQTSAFFGENIEHRVDTNVPELIYSVEKAIRERATSTDYLDRFIGHLTVCRFVFNEFERVIGAYLANRDLERLAPLADLNDWLVSATSWLEEGLVCKHEDFDPQWTTYHKRLGAVSGSTIPLVADKFCKII